MLRTDALVEDYNEFQRSIPRYLMALSSSAHTYGNIIATLQQWAIEIFSKGLFKNHVYVNSRIAHSQLMRAPQSYIKKEKPMMLLSPRIDYGADTYWKNTLLTHKRGGLHTTGTNGVVELKPFFYDMNNNVSMMFTETTRCMMIDVLVQFDTYIEQMNYMDFLDVSLDWNSPFDINTWLESYIAPEVLETLSTIVGIPVHNESDNTVTDFLNYLNGNSHYPVTYKLMGSTGREEFYRYYKTNLLVTLMNLDKNDGETVNHIRTNFGITFTIKVDFWSPSLLYLMSDKVKEDMTVMPKDSTIIPIFADVFLYEDLNLAPGWQIYGHASYILDKVEDSVSFQNLVQEKIRSLIKLQIKSGLPLCNLIDIRIRKMGRLQMVSQDYTVDFEKLTVYFNNEEWGFDTYTIIVAINTLYVNERIKEIEGLE